MDLGNGGKRADFLAEQTLLETPQIPRVGFHGITRQTPLYRQVLEETVYMLIE